MFLEVIVTIYVLYYLTTYYVNRTRYPRGPIPFPIVGNFPQIIYEAWKERGVVNAMKSYKRKYGNIYTLWFGPQPIVHIVDYNLAIEQMVKHGSDFASRFSAELQRHEREGLGINFNNGKEWQDQRRFVLQTLRNFGLGKNIMEQRIMAEFNHRMRILKGTAKNGEIFLNPISLHDILIGNIINQILFSERFTEVERKSQQSYYFPQESSEFWDIKRSLDKMSEKTSFLDIVTPHWLMMSPMLKWRVDMYQKPLIDLTEMLKKRVERRIQNIQHDGRKLTENAQDFTDAYLYKIQQDSEKEVETNFNIENLVVDLVDLWVAGQETTTTTLTWGIVFLLNDPEYIEKVYQEVRNLTKGTRHLSLLDKADTPILNAVIHETQRLASILNFNLLRKTEKHQQIGDYTIPKNVPVVAQISVIMSDDETFPDSEKFDPSRYLRDESKVKHVVPFGLGKRACLGESLARAELYLILGNFLLNYDIKPYGLVPEAKALNDNGFFKRPPRFECKFVIRE